MAPAVAMNNDKMQPNIPGHNMKWRRMRRGILKIRPRILGKPSALAWGVAGTALALWAAMRAPTGVPRHWALWLGNTASNARWVVWYTVTSPKQQGFWPTDLNKKLERETGADLAVQPVCFGLVTVYAASQVKERGKRHRRRRRGKGEPYGTNAAPQSLHQSGSEHEDRLGSVWRGLAWAGLTKQTPPNLSLSCRTVTPPCPLPTPVSRSGLPAHAVGGGRVRRGGRERTPWGAGAHAVGGGSARRGGRERTPWGAGAHAVGGGSARRGGRERTPWGAGTHAVGGGSARRGGRERTPWGAGAHAVGGGSARRGVWWRGEVYAPDPTEFHHGSTIVWSLLRHSCGCCGCASRGVPTFLDVHSDAASHRSAITQPSRTFFCTEITGSGTIGRPF
eukprot:gene10825-biopygen1789